MTPERTKLKFRRISTENRRRRAPEVVAPDLVSRPGMSDRQAHRASLLLALLGAILMFAATFASLRPAAGLPNRDSSGRPTFDGQARSQTAEKGCCPGVDGRTPRASFPSSIFPRPSGRHRFSGLFQVPLA